MLLVPKLLFGNALLRNSVSPLPPAVRARNGVSESGRSQTGVWEREAESPSPSPSKGRGETDKYEVANHVHLPRLRREHRRQRRDLPLLRQDPTPLRRHSAGRRRVGPPRGRQLLRGDRAAEPGGHIAAAVG